MCPYGILSLASSSTVFTQLWLSGCMPVTPTPLCSLRIGNLLCIYVLLIDLFPVICTEPIHGSANVEWRKEWRSHVNKLGLLLKGSDTEKQYVHTQDIQNRFREWYCTSVIQFGHNATRNHGKSDEYEILVQERNSGQLKVLQPSLRCIDSDLLITTTISLSASH